MHTEITRHWWALVLRGVVAVLFGLATLTWPGLTLVALVALFGAFALIDGVITGVAAVGAMGQGRPWIAMLVSGILGVLAGIAAFLLPGLTALSLVLLIAAWSVITGVAGVVAAVQEARHDTPRWFVGISGVLSIAFGLVLFVFPGAGALSLVWLIGVYAVIFGGMFIGAGFRLRTRHGTPRELRQVASGA